jgi:hypothetical protein
MVESWLVDFGALEGGKNGMSLKDKSTAFFVLMRCGSYDLVLV